MRMVMVFGLGNEDKQDEEGLYKIRMRKIMGGKKGGGLGD